MGGEAKKVSAGWEVDIPASIKPSDGKSTTLSASPPAHLSARTDLVLGGDYKPTAVVQFQKAALASIRGIVINRNFRCSSQPAPQYTPLEGFQCTLSLFQYKVSLEQMAC